MYKMIVIDDEDIERECLASLIPWNEYGMEVVDTAWNGIEGLEKIRALKPDVVITDIKMPVMSGIQLIEKAKAEFPHTIFVVLSGYGEYEFTSQAMELGVRYYLLKPCKEEEIARVARKVREELDESRAVEEKKQKEQARMRRLKPRAQAQLFSNMLENKENGSVYYQVFLEENQERYPSIFLLIMKFPDSPDYLEQFALTNILGEFIGESRILLATAMEREEVYLIDGRVRKDVESVADKVKREYKKLFSIQLDFTASETGGIQEVASLYRRIKGEEKTNPDIKPFLEADTRERLLFEIRLFLLRLKLEEKSLKEQKDRAASLLTGLSKSEPDREALDKIQDQGGLFQYLLEMVCQIRQMESPADKDTRRVNQVLEEFYRNIGDQDLNLQRISKEVLFMNEDYLGRLFYKQMKKRYSAYTVENRIEMARKLLEQIPDARISQVAEETGYPADGQYFSRIFKKVTGMTPSEYKERQKGANM